MENFKNSNDSVFHWQMSHWPCVKRLAHTVGMSAIQALKFEREETETLTAMAGLSMQPPVNR